MASLRVTVGFLSELNAARQRVFASRSFGGRSTLSPNEAVGEDVHDVLRMMEKTSMNEKIKYWQSIQLQGSKIDISHKTDKAAAKCERISFISIPTDWSTTAMRLRLD